MRQDSGPERSDQQRSTVTIVLHLAAYLLLAGLTGWMLCMLLLTESPLALPVMLVFIAILFLSLNRWTGVLLLIVIQLDLLFREPSRIGPANSITGVLFVVAVLALLMFVSRYHVLRQLPHHSLLDTIRKVLLLPVSAGRRSETETGVPGMPDSQQILQLASSVFRGLLWILLLVAGSRILLGYVPSARDPNTWTRITGSGTLELWPGGIVLLSALGLWVLVSEIAWRQLTCSQARLYVRSVSLGMYYPDIRMIVQRRLKLRRVKAEIVRSRKDRSAESAQ